MAARGTARRFETTGRLRATVESAAGPLDDATWARIQPDYPPDYGPEDLRETLARLALDSSTAESLPGVARRIHQAVGVSRGFRLGLGLLNLAGLTAIVPQRPVVPAAVRGQPVRSGPPSPVLRQEQFAAIGQIVVAAAAARMYADQRGLEQTAVLRAVFETADLNDKLVPVAELSHDAVGAVAEIARRYARRTFSADYQLFEADQAIRARFWQRFERWLDDPGPDPQLVEELWNGRHPNKLPPTHYRWAEYQREHAARVGRSYSNHLSYAKALNRATRKVEAFFRFSSEATRQHEPDSG